MKKTNKSIKSLFFAGGQPQTPFQPFSSVDHCPPFFPRYALGKELKTYRMKVCSLYLTSFGNFQSDVF